MILTFNAKLKHCMASRHERGALQLQDLTAAMMQPAAIVFLRRHQAAVAVVVVVVAVVAAVCS